MQLNSSAAWGDNNADLDTATGTWIVDKIIGKKTLLGGREKYHCTWQGWPASHTTWEPKHNLPRWLVAEYEAESERDVADRATADRAAAVPFVYTETEGMDHDSRRSSCGFKGSFL